MQTTFFYCREDVFTKMVCKMSREGSVYIQRPMVFASLLDSIDMLVSYRAVVVTCKPYNQRTEQFSYFIDHFNEQLKTDS